MTLRRWAIPHVLLVGGGLLFATPPSALSQSRTSLGVEENFRLEPNGVILARIEAGTPVTVLSREGNWSEVEVGGYVWLRSLQASGEASFDLVVSAQGGENLRDGPSGRILARLEEGALLEEVDRDPAWAQVRRVGWVWSPSLMPEEADDAPVAPAPTGGEAAPPPAGEPAGPATRRPGGFRSSAGGAILTAPDGDTLAVTTPASDLEVLRAEGNWVRVRVEGWMWMPEAASAAAEGEAPVALEPADVGADPEAHAGRVVSWSLQFISLERAESVRTDFFEGEPFLLTRYGGADGPFVYVAVPAERVGDVEGLVPLERIDVTGRIRTGASALTGAPILDLIGIERARGQR